jgi:hypothetical protein
MEFIALLIFLLLAGTGLVLGPFALTTPGAALAALAGVGGLVACGLFIAFDGNSVAGWALVGLSVLGVAGGAIAAAWLTSDRRSLSLAGQTAEEVQAAVVGLQLPFFLTAVPVALLVALHSNTVS